MDSELYPYVDQMARAQSDGLIGGDEIMAVFSGFVFVMGAIAVIMLIIDLTVGILGLSRSRRPEKYRFSWVGESHCWSSAVLAPC